MADATCTIPGCPKPVRVKSRGWCEQHYSAWKRHGDPLIRKSRRLTQDSGGFRTCNKCKRVLPLSENYRQDKSKAGGYCTTCKDCCAVRDAAYHQANRDARLAYQAIYRADPEHRRKDRESSARWRAENPEWARELHAAWLARPENQQRIRQYLREWNAANPGRKREYDRHREALKKSSVATRISMELLAGKLAYWGGRCWVAGPRCTVDPEQWDHVKPLSKGGPHLLANLRPACSNCNNSKKARWPYSVVLAWRAAS
jgi:5-methylcytosine-specific restriction endonuclease McrA